MGVGVGFKLIIGNGLYGYISGAEGARPTTVEAAEGRFHNGGWKDCKYSHTTHSQ